MNKPITFQNSISNEEAALLPAIEFRGPIVVVDSEPRLREACRYLAAQPVIGSTPKPGLRSGRASSIGSHCCNSPRRNRASCSALQDSSRQSHRQNPRKQGDPENRRRCKGRPAGTAQHPALSGSGFVDLQELAGEWGIEEKSLRKLRRSYSASGYPKLSA
mgnify:CR=1 FL=1